MKEQKKILWLRPTTGDNVSIRRERIIEHLEKREFEVTLQNASGRDSLTATIEAIRGDYDIIVGNVRLGLYLGYLLSVLLRIPFVGDVSDPIHQIDHLPSPLYRILEWYEWFVISRADMVVFVYQSSYQEALEKGIVDPVRLPNAVDHERFADPDNDVVKQARDILRENNIDPESQIAIYTGSMVSRYHLAEIGDASEQLPEWEFVFIGEERGAEIHSIVAGRANTHFLGAFDYELIPGFLAHSNLGLCLVDAEQPLKLKEFTAAGLPTLVIPSMQQWYDYDNLIFIDPTPRSIVSAVNSLDGLSVSDRHIDIKENELENWEDISQQYHQIFNQLYDRSG